ncbi:MAG: hypothetical protein V2I56_14530 [Desulfobacteraceae bacterium]|nr:hypothetical protein [Desulfobacteraceae bacterium]
MKNRLEARYWLLVPCRWILVSDIWTLALWLMLPSYRLPGASYKGPVTGILLATKAGA